MFECVKTFKLIWYVFMQYVIQVIIICTFQGFCNSRSEPCEINVSKVADEGGVSDIYHQPSLGRVLVRRDILFLYASMFYEFVLLGKSITQYDAYLLLHSLF